MGRPDTGVMANDAAFQVIVLGPTGGPREDNVTGILVRSTSTQWSPNSMVAVDAGTLLAGIIRTLERYKTEPSDGGKFVMKDGPFAGLVLPSKTPQANSAHIFREILGAVLITHPHLDHLSGLAINTPMLEAGSGPKAVTALPSVVAAIKNHMFNDVIWPNLSDEDGGAGLLTYHRLVEGGNPRFGRWETRGYVRACNGLLTKCLAVSHGRCRQRYQSESHQRVGSAVFADPLMVPSRAISADNTDGGHSPARSPCFIASNPKEPVWTTVESSAFFIRDHHTTREIILFGDVEPDSLSLDPRNRRVWEVAAPKVANGTLRAIFIECSYDDSIDDASLYGHLCPRHLITELSVLATKVEELRTSIAKSRGKRKREDSSSPDDGENDVSPKSKRSRSTVGVEKVQLGGEGAGDGEDTVDLSTESGQPDPKRRETRSKATGPGTYDGSAEDEVEQTDTRPDQGQAHASDETQGQGHGQGQGCPTPKTNPLNGLSVYIIHIKDNLSDAPPPGNQILAELQERGEAAKLGCDFRLPNPGEGIWI